MDPAAAPVAPGGATLASELIARAAAIGAGKPGATSTSLLPRDLRDALHACEERARRLADGWGQGAALDFLGDAVVAVAVEHRFEAGEARKAVTAAAAELGMPAEAAAFAVFRRALASKEFAQLPPTVAAELALTLLVELAPASIARASEGAVRGLASFARLFGTLAATISSPFSSTTPATAE